jgi:isopenicillin-N epimerase
MPGTDPLQNRLHQTHGLEVPVMTWPIPPHRLIRISAQIYNNLAQYKQLATALGAV